ncbi:MAG TPA: sugar phosphate nucleotidyltransferase [Longimicrobiaceae bacterium]
MDAMILAAGLGTRLRPLTDRIPKALIEVGGMPILGRVAHRLIEAGADRLIINLHHLGDRIREYVTEMESFGVEVVFSEEAKGALETGGAILKARGLLRADAPFFLHNADILSDLPLSEMYRQHLRSGALATLAVMARPSTRYLLFDEDGLFGRVDERKEIRLITREPVGQETRLAFAGVHVIDPRFPRLLHERGAFSILEPYLRLVEEGERILPFRIDGYQWIDIGKPEQLAEARAIFAGS